MKVMSKVVLFLVAYAAVYIGNHFVLNETLANAPSLPKIFMETKLKCTSQTLTAYICIRNHTMLLLLDINGWQLAKMKKSIPDMSLP